MDKLVRLPPNARGHIQLITYAMRPNNASDWRHVDYADHTQKLRFAPNDPEFITSVYGPASDQAAGAMAYNEAVRKESEVVALRMLFKLRGNAPKKIIDRTVAHSTGYFHVGRLQMDYRETVHQEILDRIRHVCHQEEYDQLKRLSLDDLFVRRPALARLVLEMYPLVDAVFHRAHLEFSGPLSQPVTVCTVRASQAADMQAETRYFETKILVSINGRPHGEVH